MSHFDNFNEQLWWLWSRYMSHFDDFDDSRVIIWVILLTLMTLMTMESLYEWVWCDFLAHSQIWFTTLYLKTFRTLSKIRGQKLSFITDKQRSIARILWSGTKSRVSSCAKSTCSIRGFDGRAVFFALVI